MKLIKSIYTFFRRAYRDLIFVFLNFFVNYIPIWHFRKFIYQLLGMKIGKGARIALGTIVEKPQYIIIGERTIINEKCHIDGRGGLKIGNDVSISIYSKIITASHYKDSCDFEYYNGKVIIKDNVWLGCNAIILDSSIIEGNTIIGAGSVFKGNSNKNDIYIGNPATLVSKRNLKEKYKIQNKTYFR